MNLDDKEEVMIRHYSTIFKSHCFDEYDVLGFLIVIRRLIRSNNTYRGILEFADLIAHRERDRGQAFNAVKQAIENEYATYDGKKVIGYEGITESEWKSEWESLCGELKIPYTKQLIDEITLCICSLANGSLYKKGNDHIGKMYIAVDSDTVALMTTEGKKDSLSVGFFVYKGISAEVKKGYEFPGISIETKRVNDRLVLVADDNECFFKLRFENNLL
jgi:hypothetical protein